MGPTFVSGAGTGPGGSATQGTLAAPTCGMTPFMSNISGSVSGCTSGTGTCFTSGFNQIGFCTGAAGLTAEQGLPQSSDSTVISATNCAGTARPLRLPDTIPLDPSFGQRHRHLESVDSILSV